MFIDEAEILIQGGDGGPGKVAFYNNKNGPCGGNGGRGGDVYFVVNTSVTDLKRFSHVATFKGQDGQQGGSYRSKGASGKELLLQIPLYTLVVNAATNEEIVFIDKEMKYLICKGGDGGMGNNSFKSATNRTPHHATPGGIGEEKKILLLMKLIANYGLIGLPNAGKSSLLNKLTNANVKTANYPFTTLEPNLGVMDGKVLADIPGLIEGASTGKGLGIKFLKHIEKVTLLLHCISVESENIDKDYNTVIDEISKYNKEIPTKKTIILLTKTDLVTPEVVREKINKLKKFGLPIISISIYNQPSLNELKKVLL